MKKKYQQILISVFTFLGGVYFFLEFFLPEKLPKSLGSIEFGKYHSQISNYFIVIGVMAIGLGIFNIVWIHSNNLIKSKTNKINSLAIIFGLAITIMIGSMDIINSQKHSNNSQHISLIGYLTPPPPIIVEH